jgi:hypothetical protein
MTGFQLVSNKKHHQGNFWKERGKPPSTINVTQKANVKLEIEIYRENANLT